MNRGILESLPVQQMMTGNPNWWNINAIRRPTHQQQQHPSPFLPSSAHPSLFPSQLYPPPPSASSFPINSWHLDNNQELPESWSQLLLGGLVGEEDQRSAQLNHYHQQVKKLENWEQEQILYPPPSNIVPVVDVKQEVPEGAYMYSLGDEEFQAARPNLSNHHQVMPASSPKSCVTSFSSNKMLDFSNRKADGRHQQPDLSSECNITTTGGAFKKARVQSSSTQSTFKVRKEKLGDRITALHQLVSPFGKTDTASVLLEVIGYIRFLQSQIEALSSPYLGNSGSGNKRQQCVQGEKNSIFPEDPGQLLNDTSTKRRGIPDQDRENEPKKDLRSRGLCLVPVSYTLQVGSENGADYWSPTLGGGFR